MTRKEKKEQTKKRIEVLAYQTLDVIGHTLETTKSVEKALKAGDSFIDKMIRENPQERHIYERAGHRVLDLLSAKGKV